MKTYIIGGWTYRNIDGWWRVTDCPFAGIARYYFRTLADIRYFYKKYAYLRRKNTGV